MWLLCCARPGVAGLLFQMPPYNNHWLGWTVFFCLSQRKEFSRLAVPFPFMTSFFFLFNNPLLQTSDDPLQYPSGKQFLCSFLHSSSNASLPLTSLSWAGSSVLLTSNFTSRGSTKPTIQVLKIRTVRPAFQRTETRKEERKQPVWKPGIYSIQKKLLKMLLCVCVQYLLWY